MKSLQNGCLTWGARLLLGMSLIFRPLIAAALGGALTVQIDSTDAKAYPTVHAYVTVRDENGVPVGGLAAQNFEVNEDRAPKALPLTSVETRANPASALWVVLAIDVSGSMAGQRLADAKAAATRFLDLMSPNDRVAAYAFSGQVDLNNVEPKREVTFTTDKAPLYAFIDGLQAGDRTPLYDAAYKSVLMLDKAPAGEPRAILLFTDGRDEGSRVAGLDTAATEAQRRAIPVFTIGLGDADTAFIQELARRTGGAYQPAADSSALAGLFQGVAQTLKAQYVLTYQSSLPPDGQAHRLTVKVTDASGASANTEAALGPLPLIASATPAPTATGPATAASTVTPAATGTAAPSPTVRSSPAPQIVNVNNAPIAGQSSSVGWLALAVVALLLAGGAAVFFARRRPAHGPYCMNCGYDFHGAPDGPCPSCGGTRRSARLPGR